MAIKSIKHSSVIRALDISRCYDLLKLSHHCNANALTDLAASAELAHSAAKIAQMNVKINTQYISGNDVDSIDHDTEIVIGKCDEKMLDLRSIYTERLGW